MIYLIRHGETPWSLADKHTGLTDLELTPRGKEEAEAVRKKLTGYTFDRVFVSPLKRARQTCDICGFGGRAEIMNDLVEWDYGDYEGMTTPEIHKKNPGWTIFSDGAPGGEAPLDVEKRARRVLEAIGDPSRNIALFSSGHFLRSLATIYLGLPISDGRAFFLSTASLSILGLEHNLPVIRLWNS